MLSRILKFTSISHDESQRQINLTKKKRKKIQFTRCWILGLPIYMAFVCVDDSATITPSQPTINQANQRG